MDESPKMLAADLESRVNLTEIRLWLCKRTAEIGGKLWICFTDY